MSGSLAGLVIGLSFAVLAVAGRADAQSGGPRGERTRGFLLDLEGTPVAGARVEFRATDGSEYLSSARSDAEGSFAIDTAGRAGHLYATEPHLSTAWFGHTRRPDPLIPPVVLAAARRTVVGQVLDEDGAPVEGARVSIELDVSGLELRLRRSTPVSFSFRTGADGRFEFSGAPAAEDVRLRATRDRYASVEMPLARRQGEIPVELRRLARGPEHIEGVVLDPGGAPVRCARVSCAGDVGSSKDDGTFELRPEHPEQTGDAPAVLAFAPGWMPVLAVAREGAVEILLRDRVPPIRGRVVDATGNPVPKAVVALLDPPTLAEIEILAGVADHEDRERADDAIGCHPVVADEEGRFEIAKVIPRGFSVRAHDPRSLATAAARGVGPGAVIELRIAERPLVEVRGRVVDPRGRPIVGAFVSLLREPDGPRPIESAGRWTDVEGRFAWSAVDVEGLAIAVQVQSYADPQRHPYGAPERGERTLVAARPARVQVRVARTELGADAFRILDAGGRPLWLGDDDGSREALGGSASDELDLGDEGGTEPFWVSEDARSLLLLRQGVEVARVPIRFVPGEPGEIVLVRP